MGVCSVRALPSAVAILNGVKPVVIAVVAQALLGLGRTALKTRALAIIAIGATVAAANGMNELLVLAVAGACAVVARRCDVDARGAWGGSHATARRSFQSSQLRTRCRCRRPELVAVQAAVATPVSIALGPLFLIFLKIGAVLFGSGYVLLAFLRADLVERLHWLTERQLLDAVAIGQVTPGPVFTTATFIGYILRGPSGAAAATLGIFLPAFVFVAISGPLVPRLRRSPTAGAVLDGVNVASLALMAVVAWQLGRSALVDVTAIVLCVASALLLLRWRVNSAWLVLGGAAVGLAARLFSTR